MDHAKSKFSKRVSDIKKQLLVIKNQVVINRQTRVKVEVADNIQVRKVVQQSHVILHVLVLLTAI